MIKNGKIEELYFAKTNRASAWGMLSVETLAEFANELLAERDEAIKAHLKKESANYREVLKAQGKANKAVQCAKDALLTAIGTAVKLDRYAPTSIENQLHMSPNENGQYCKYEDVLLWAKNKGLT